MKWFKHSGTASRDARVAKLMADFGIEGYGLYFYCLELIASKTDSDDLTFELEHDAQLIAHWCQMDTVKVEKIMHRCVELGLFDLSDTGQIVCLKLIKWCDRKLVGEKIYKEMLDKSSYSYRLSGKIPDISGENPLLLDKIRIEKNRIESTADKPPPRPRFQKPTLEQLREYILSRHSSVDPERWLAYYEANGWRVGRNPMKDWQAAVRTWERNGFEQSTSVAPASIPPPDAERIERRVRELVASGRFTEAEARADPWHPKRGVTA